MQHNSGKGKIIIIVALAAVAVLAGLGIFMIKGKKSAKPEKPPTFEMALGEFVVNLADADEVRYLKADIVLEVEGTPPAAAGGEGESKGGGSPKIRDAVIQVLSSKHFAELVKPEGKEELKKEIIAAINGTSAEDTSQADSKEVDTDKKGENNKADKEAAATDGKDENEIKAVGVYFNEFAMQ